MLAAEPLSLEPRAQRGRWYLTPQQRDLTQQVLDHYDDYQATIDRYPERRRALEEMADRLPWLRPLVQSGTSKPTERLGTALAATDEEYAEAVRRVAQTNAVLFRLERRDRLGRQIADLCLLRRDLGELTDEQVSLKLGVSYSTLWRHRAEVLFHFAVAFGFAHAPRIRAI